MSFHDKKMYSNHFIASLLIEVKQMKKSNQVKVKLSNLYNSRLVNKDRNCHFCCSLLAAEMKSIQVFINFKIESDFGLFYLRSSEKSNRNKRKERFYFYLGFFDSHINTKLVEFVKSQSSFYIRTYMCASLSV